MKVKAGLVAVMISAAPAAAAEPVNILATIGMIGDLAAQLGGPCARVETLVGPGADPHLFTPAPSDLKKLQRAEILFYSGLNLEGQLGNVLDRLAQSRTVVALAERAISPDQLLIDGDTPDPHVWMDIALWQQIVPPIAQEIIKARPDCAQMIDANATSLISDLQSLDLWAKKAISSIPDNQRHLITAHDAFGYFGRAYDIQVSAIQGISTQAQAAIADIDAVATLIAQSGVPAVFIETTINPRTIQALSEAVSAKGSSVAIGGEIFADSMGAAGTPEGSYIGMMRHNVLTITNALGGQAPAEVE